MTPVLRVWGMVCLDSRHVIRDVDGKGTDLHKKGATFYHFTSLIAQKLQARELCLSWLKPSTGGSDGQGAGGHLGKDNFQERLNCEFASSVNPSFAGLWLQVLLGFCWVKEWVKPTAKGGAQTRADPQKGVWGNAIRLTLPTSMDAISMPSNAVCPTAWLMQCRHPWRHFSTAPFIPISSRGRFNNHEVTAAAACVDAPPPLHPT